MINEFAYHSNGMDTPLPFRRVVAASSQIGDGGESEVVAVLMKPRQQDGPLGVSVSWDDLPDEEVDDPMKIGMPSVDPGGDVPIVIMGPVAVEVARPVRIRQAVAVVDNFGRVGGIEFDGSVWTHSEGESVVYPTWIIGIARTSAVKAGDVIAIDLFPSPIFRSFFSPGNYL